MRPLARCIELLRMHERVTQPEEEEHLLTRIFLSLGDRLLEEPAVGMTVGLRSRHDIERLDPQQAGGQRGQERLHELLGPPCISGVHPPVRRPDGAPRDGIEVVGRRQPRGVLRKLCSGCGRPASTGDFCRPVECRCHIGSRLGGSQSQVLRVRLRIHEERRQPQVHLAPPASGRQRGRSFGEQGMSEAHALPLGD